MVSKSETKNIPEKRRRDRLRSAVDKLGQIRIDPDSSALRRMRSNDQALIIVDESLAIVSATAFDRLRAMGVGWAFDVSGHQLSAELNGVLRCARDEWFSDDDGGDIITIYRGAHVMLIFRLRGFIANHMVISFQDLARRATLRDEALRYDLTMREYDVLRLALGGFSASEIARQLAIAETTAQVYLKRLLQKTNSRNRAQMVATVLGSRMSHDAEVHDVIASPPSRHSTDHFVLDAYVALHGSVEISMRLLLK